jgi:hypothetical protein
MEILLGIMTLIIFLVWTSILISHKKPKKIRIKINEKGIKFIYNDELRPLLQIGKSKIQRASHVEPTDDNKWIADLAPSGGPILGPFQTRTEALQAEVQWIDENMRGDSEFKSLCEI